MPSSTSTFDGWHGWLVRVHDAAPHSAPGCAIESIFIHRYAARLAAQRATSCVAMAHVFAAWGTHMHIQSGRASKVRAAIASSAAPAPTMQRCKVHRTPEMSYANGGAHFHSSSRDLIFASGLYAHARVHGSNWRQSKHSSCEASCAVVRCGSYRRRGLSVGVGTDPGAKEQNDDRLAATDINELGFVAGVFDGHRGSACADYVSKNMPQALLSAYKAGFAAPSRE